jgi:hypothetical protein
METIRQCTTVARYYTLISTGATYILLLHFYANILLFYRYDPRLEVLLYAKNCNKLIKVSAPLELGPSSNIRKVVLNMCTHIWISNSIRYFYRNDQTKPFHSLKLYSLQCPVLLITSSCWYLHKEWCSAQNPCILKTIHFALSERLHQLRILVLLQHAVGI